MIDPNWKPKPLFDISTGGAPQQQQKNTGGVVGSLLKSFASPFVYLSDAAIVNPARELAAQFTGNKVALKNARKQSNLDLGLGEQGTNIGNASKKFAGNSAQALLTVGTGGLNSALASKGAGLGTRVAADAAIGAGFGGSAELARDGSTLSSTLKQAALGGATSGALSGVLGGIPKVSNKLSGKFSGAADSAATKALKINDPTFLENFANRYGEEAGSTANRFGLVGKNPKSIAGRLLKPGYAAYEKGIESLGSVTKSDLLTSTAKTLDSYTSSPLPEDRAFAVDVYKKLTELTSKYDGEIPAADLNKIKSALAGKVNYKLMDAAGARNNSLYESSAKAVRTAINDAAEKAGITVNPATIGKGYRSTSLGDLGDELSQIETLTKKASIKARVGAGSNPVKLTGTIAAAPAAAINPVAGVAGYLATSIPNSNVGKRAIASGLSGLSGALANSTSKTLPAAGAALAGLLPGAINQSSKNAEQIPATKQNNTIPSTYDIGSPYSQNDVSASPDTSGDPFAPENIQANIQQLVAGGATLKDIQEYVDLAKTVQALTPQSKAPKLNATQLQQANNSVSALSDIQLIRDTLSENPNASKLNALPGGGLTRSLTGTSNYEAARQNVADALGRLRSGGAINADEEKRFLGLLPGAFDSSDVADKKLARLESLFNQFANPVSSAQDTQTADLASILAGYGQ